jgi:hypothetical protein
MPDSTRIFGIYPTSQQAEAAVDRLLEAEFAGWAISVLHSDNQSTREFAERKNTRPPEGTAHGKTASVPLDGTLGLLHPGAGPVEGALSAALAGMGVPALSTDCNRKVGRPRSFARGFSAIWPPSTNQSRKRSTSRARWRLQALLSVRPESGRPYLAFRARRVEVARRGSCYGLRSPHRNAECQTL